MKKSKKTAKNSWKKSKKTAENSRKTA